MDQSRENRIEDSQDEIDIGELLRYLKTKWIVIMAVFLIGVIGSGVGTKCLITPKYTAVSKLYVVSASGKNIVNLDDLRLGTTLSSDYTELLKTRPICNEIISDLGLDYTVGQLKSMISIVPIEDTRLLTVSVDRLCMAYRPNLRSILFKKFIKVLSSSFPHRVFCKLSRDKNALSRLPVNAESIINLIVSFVNQSA